MQRLAEEAFRRFTLQSGDRVLEIGSGDGFQLGCFRDRGARVLGFEPSAELCRRSKEKNVDVVQCLFTTAETGPIPGDMQPVQVVLLSYTFDHLPDPRALLDAVRTALDPERGVLLIEVHDLEKIVQRREACLFEHEHTVYLHRGSLRRLLESAGYKLLTTQLVPEEDRRANSLLVVAALLSSQHTPDESVAVGDTRHLDDWACYSDFARRVDASHDRLRRHVRAQIEQGRRVAGYGAGGRGVMTLALAGLTACDIAYLCDANPALHDRYTPATHVPVVPPQHLIDDPVDEVIVFSYGYLDEIRAQWNSVAPASRPEDGCRFTSLLDVL